MFAKDKTKHSRSKCVLVSFEHFYASSPASKSQYSHQKCVAHLIFVFWYLVCFSCSIIKFLTKKCKGFFPFPPKTERSIEPVNQRLKHPSYFSLPVEVLPAKYGGCRFHTLVIMLYKKFKTQSWCSKKSKTSIVLKQHGSYTSESSLNFIQTKFFWKQDLIFSKRDEDVEKDLKTK